MRAGDRVQFVAERGSTPVPGAVTFRYGESCWVDLLLDSGESVQQVLSAKSHFQSPKGHYCLKDDTPTHIAAVDAAGEHY